MLLTLTFEVQGEASYAHQQSRGIGVEREGQTRDATLKGVGPHRGITEKGKGNRCPVREGLGLFSVSEMGMRPDEKAKQEAGMRE